tara:strand:- start:263 stop:463 length:201 start_codon:yes stop_codon:yes gene_type:complete
LTEEAYDIFSIKFKPNLKKILIMKIEQIKIGDDCYHEDTVDIQGSLDGIQEVGLLRPVVVNVINFG